MCSTTVKDAAQCSDYKRLKSLCLLCHTTCGLGLQTNRISLHPVCSVCKIMQPIHLHSVPRTGHQILYTKLCVQCKSRGSSCLLTWQPAFSSICAYFTVLSMSGKTRILHVMGTESFSLASKTEKD